MKVAHILILISFLTSVSFCQSDEDALYIKKIHDFALTQSQCFEDLRTLCKDVGHRLAGSAGDAAASNWGKDRLAEISDTAYLQPCVVNGWSRGSVESLFISVQTADGKLKTRSISMLTLGHSVGTSVQGVKGQIIEVQSLDEVRKLGRAGVQGRVVFYNRPMDPTQTATMRAYGGAVDQRVYGAAVAGEYGAVGSITRSMSIGLDTFPHTGTLIYPDSIVDRIPGICISTQSAEELSDILTNSQGVEAHIITTCSPSGPKASYSVVGEIRGTEFPEEIILVGGHLDSWDVGEGAHDDGTGVVQSIEVLNTLQKIGYKPNRTIRCVLFANEESGLAGGKQYALTSQERGEYHLAAIESDAGGFTPRGFKMEGHGDTFSQLYQSVSKWSPLFEAYGLMFSNGGSGADIAPLKPQKGLLVGLSPDSQRYFDVHHTHNDVFENVHPRELQLGAAAMTSLVYLIDKYGLN